MTCSLANHFVLVIVAHSVNPDIPQHHAPRLILINRICRKLLIINTFHINRRANAIKIPGNPQLTFTKL